LISEAVKRDALARIEDSLSLGWNDPQNNPSSHDSISHFKKTLRIFGSAFILLRSHSASAHFPLPPLASTGGQWGFSFPPLHASHFSTYMLKMVGYVTILGLYQHNNSAALSDLEPLNYLK